MEDQKKSIRHIWRIERKVSAIYGGLKEKYPPFMED
jgi:hypothetical protein